MKTADAATGERADGGAVFAPAAGDVPVMPDDAPRPADPATLQGLRQFHFTGAADHLAPIEPGSLLPALLFPFRDPRRVRGDYPLCIPGGAAGDDPPCQPLRTCLEQAMTAAGAGQVARDNLTRLEVLVRRALGDAGTPQPARPLVAAGAEALVEELSLRGDSLQRLERDLRATVDNVGAAAALLAASPEAPVHLFLAAARRTLGPRRAAFRRRVEAVCARLEAVLEVERGKEPDARDAARLGAAVGPAGSALLDPGRLAEVVGGHRGTRAMPPGQRRLVEDALRRLREFLAAGAWPTACVLGPGVAPLDGAADVVWHDVADVCAAAATQFDAVAHEWTEVFRAVRRARQLENPEYDPDRHDAWADTFGWESFSEEELHLLPCVLAVGGFAPATLPELSQLLLSGRRVHVLLAQDPLCDPGTGEVAGRSFRLELAYLAMAHREAFVQQASAARPDLLLDGFCRAIAGTRAACTVLDTPARKPVGAWLRSRAAVEARAHPLFSYDPEAGVSWARRLTLAGNPAPADDWSAQEMEYRAAAGPDRMRLAFTFADLCLLDRGLAPCFLSIPRGLACDDLVELSDYLALAPDAATHHLPYLWAADQNGELRRVLVTFALARAVRERLGFWRCLQDLAGVRSESVERAVAEAEARAASRFEAEKAQLLASHDEALAAARSTAASDAMQGLAQMLLDTDLGALAEVDLAAPPVTVPRPAPPAAAPEQEPEPVAAAPEPPATEEAAAEPWVETVLCTSCNDCVSINARLFVYDENKQVYLGDARAGTYRQLVEAAEKCPAKCIHPGLPLDPGEADLDALRARAAPFN